MFRRKPPEPPEVVLTTEAYGRWLRAQQPQPVAWFLGLSTLEQEALALLGDEYAQDLCVALGYAVANPQAAAAGLDAVDSVESEEALVRQLVTAFTQKTQAAPRMPQEPPKPSEPLSMAGVAQRREVAAQDRQEAKNNGRSLFGRKPDDNHEDGPE